METVPAFQEEMRGKQQFRQQLAAVVRNIQWSYAIFWSISPRQPGVLAWSDGYYNGDIKTRKTTQPMEFKAADQMGLQRSEQLRELYESLSAGDGNQQQSKRPSASLSPEDLTDTEWYYLVCMSFTFASGTGLPGKALASNEQIWLCNAQFVDSKTFTRSLLAKSASIQTVVCIPFLSGVLELGTTELILEDPALVKHVTTSFWELPFSVCSDQSIPSPPLAETEQDHKIETVGSPDFPFVIPSQKETEELHPSFYEDLNIDSPDDSWKDPCPSQRIAGSFGVNTEFIDEDFCNGTFHSTLNSSEYCLSPKGEGGVIKNSVLETYQEGDEIDLVSLNLDGDASHYTKTLATVLRNSKKLNTLAWFMNGSSKSSFVVWRSKGFGVERQVLGMPQKLLKKVLSGGAWMNCGAKSQLEGDGVENQGWKSGVDASASHVLSERRRREKLNEKFLVLRSLVPSISKADKASILGDTIEYVKELERRVEELESCNELFNDHESKAKRKHPDLAERISDNYCTKTIPNGKKVSASKRKARDIILDETEAEHHHWIYSNEGGPLDVNVTLSEREACLELHCHWREFLLLEIFEAIGNLHMDPLSVQASVSDGLFSLSIKAKFINSAISSPGMIKQTLQRVVSKF